MRDAVTFSGVQARQTAPSGSVYIERRGQMDSRAKIARGLRLCRISELKTGFSEHAALA